MFLIKIKGLIIILLVLLFIIMALYIFLNNKNYYNVCSNLPFVDENLRKNNE